MKKIMILTFLTFLAFVSFLPTTYANETTGYLGGKNYLNLGNLRMYDGQMDFAHTVDQISVKPNTSYTLVLDYEFLGPHASYPEYLEVTIEQGFIGNMYTQNFVDDSSNGRAYVEFIPVTDWVKFHFIPMGNTRNYDAILYEGLYSSFTGYEPYLCDTEIMRYEGILPMDVDALLTTEQITSLIQAKDPYGGNLVYIVETDEYSTSLKKPGSYEMVFMSTYNQISKKYFLDVKVFDLVSPMITSPQNIQIQLGNKKTIDEIKQLITVTDNVDEMTSSDLVVTQDTYSPATSVGNYSITVEATDTSGNKSSLLIPIQLLDLVGPTISGPYSIFLYTTDGPLTNQQILNKFTVRDDVDGTNVSFQITTNEYNQQTLPGVYRVTLRAGDQQYNFTYKYIEIHVVENRGPVFIEDEAILSASAAEHMSEQDIIDWFKNLTQLSGFLATQIKIVYNEYKGNEELGGSYYIYLNYDLDGQVQTSRIRVDVEELSNDNKYLVFGSIGGVVVLGTLSFFIIKKKKL